MYGAVDRVGAMRSSVMFGPGAFLQESAGTVARSELSYCCSHLSYNAQSGRSFWKRLNTV